MNYYLFRFALVCLNNQGVQGGSLFDVFLRISVCFCLRYDGGTIYKTFFHL
ncbi:MAG: hypothetical protein HW390_2723 [Candidatus Brocadiaceae bacterium]|nr:hypothetical protein [Candidatus Brocadiaceae bacterium]